MRYAALTLMALSVLSACAESTDASARAFNAPAYSALTNGSTSLFTTYPAYFANPPAYATDPYYLSMAPYYRTGIGYFIFPIRWARHAYCPPRGGFLHHR
jgi:hypothetical protein